MGSLIEIGLSNAAVAGALALVALGAERWSRRPALVHVLWLLVLVKLVTPPVIPLALPWWRDASEPAARKEKPAPVELPTGDVASVLLPAPPPAPPATMPAFARLEDLMAEKMGAPSPAALEAAAPMMPRMMPSAPAPRAVEPAAPPVPPAPAKVKQAPAIEPVRADTRGDGVAGLVGVVWVGGAVVWLLIAAWRIVCFQRMLKYVKPAGPSLQLETDVIARKLGLGRSPRVWLIPGPVPPLVWAVGGRAQLFFPETLLPRLEQSERATLLAHELAHLGRRDHWVRFLELFVAAAYWWYPLVWLACRKLQAAEEECCDAWVVDAMPGFGTAYAGALLETVDFLAQEPAALPPGASGFGRMYHLKRRLTMIVRGSPPRGLSLVGKLLVLCLVVALPLTPSRAKPAAPPTDTEETETTAVVKLATPEKPRQVALPVAHLPEEPDRYQTAPRTLQSAEGGQVWGTAISPDGKTLAVVMGGTTRNSEGALTLYDLTTGAERVTLAHPRPLRCIAWSPDGKHLATGDYVGKTQLRDPATGAVRIAIDGHSGMVKSLAFTPDGKSVVTGSLDKSIRLWDAISGKALKTLTGHTDWVLHVAVSPDGKTLLSVSKDTTGRVWNLIEGKEWHVLKGHTGWVEGCAISPDGKAIVTTGHDNLVKLWDAESGKLLRDLAGHTGVVNAAAFFPDGKTLATCSHDRTVRLWNAATGALAHTIETEHAESVYALAISKDGKTFVSGAWDRAVKVWDAVDRGLRHTLTAKRYNSENNYPILSIAASPDGKTLAVSGEERAVKLLDATTGSLLRLLEGHEDVVARVAFSPDGRVLASASFDGTIRLWDVVSGKPLQTLRGHSGWVFSVTFAPDGRTLASGGYDKTARLWDAGSGKLLATLDRHKGGVRAVAYSPDGKTLATGGTDKTIRVWSLATRDVVHTMRGHEDAVRDLAWAPDGLRLASCAEDLTVRLWQVRDEKPLASHKTSDVPRGLAFSPRGTHLAVVDQSRVMALLNGQTLQSRMTSAGNFNAAATCVAFGPDAKQLYAGSLDRTVRVWQGQVAPRQAMVSYPVSSKQQWVASYSPDGRLLAMAGADSVLRVRDVRFGQLAGMLDETPAAVFGMAISPDRTKLAVACFDKAVRMYDLPSRKLLATFSPHKDRVWTVAFSPDGKRLAAASGSYSNADDPGDVKVWDVTSRKELLDLPGIEAAAMAVAWSPDGKWLAVGTRDGKARLFDAASGKERHDLKGHKESVRFAKFSPDGRYLATAGMDDATVRIWAVESGAAVAALQGHKSGVNCVDWSADGKTLAASSRPRGNANETGEVWLWAVAEENGQPKFTEKAKLKGLTKQGLACAFSPDGKLVAGCGGTYQTPGETCVWEVATGKLLAMLHGHRRWCEGLLFTPDGKTLITAGGTHDSGGEVRFWNVGDRGGWEVAKAHPGEISCSAWSPDGKTLATGGGRRTIKLWDAESGKLLHTFENTHKKFLRAIVFRPDGKMLASASEDETVKLWDVEGKREVAELARHPVQVNALAFSPDGKLLATGSGHTSKDDPLGTVRVFEVDTGKERLDAEWIGKPVTTLAISPDGKQLVTGGRGPSNLRVYDLSTGKQVKQIQNASSIRVGKFSPDGKLFVTGHGAGAAYGEGSLQVWETATWTERAGLTGHGKVVLGLSWAPDSRHVASASVDGSIKIWDVQATPSNPTGLVARKTP